MAALALWACDPGPRIQDCKIQCGAQGVCPEGTRCANDGFCRPPGATGICGCPGGDVAPLHVADSAVDFDGAGFDGGVAVVWAEPSAGRFAIAYRVFDAQLATLLPEAQLALANAGLSTVTAAASGRRLWLFWQEGGAAGGGARVIDLGRPTAPADLPGFPRPEATTSLSAVGTPAGLVAAWGAGASTIRLGRWPDDGGLPATTDLPLPLSGVTRLRRVLLSSGATAVGFEAEVGASVRRGVIELASSRLALDAFGALVDGPEGTGVYWCELATSRLLGRTEVFAGGELEFHAAPASATITLCTALASARGPVLAWVEGGQLSFGLPNPAGGLLRNRAVNLAGLVPIVLTAASSGGASATAFFSTDDVLLDLWAAQACLP